MYLKKLEGNVTFNINTTSSFPRGSPVCLHDAGASVCSHKYPAHLLRQMTFRNVQIVSEFSFVRSPYSALCHENYIGNSEWVNRERFRTQLLSFVDILNFYPEVNRVAAMTSGAIWWWSPLYLMLYLRLTSSAIWWWRLLTTVWLLAPSCGRVPLL